MEEMTWGILLVGYLFLGGMAGGAFAVGALLDLFKKSKYRILSKSGVYVSIVSIIVGLVMLVLDLKRFEVAPLSILNAYRRFPDSIMSVGTWIITGLTLVSLVTAILWFFEGNCLVRKLLEIVGIVLGISTAAYTGILLSFARGRPFWNSPYIPLTFIVSGTLTGLAIALLLIPIIAIFVPRFFKEFKELFNNREEYAGMLGDSQRYIVSLIIVELFLVVLELGTSHADISLLTSGSFSMLFFAYVILGLIAPLGIAYYIAKLESARASAIKKFLPNTLKQISVSVILFSLSGFVLILIGGFLLRYVILIAGQIII
jgi:formate-dependent nitrite reductase membrane component NrfD